MARGKFQIAERAPADYRSAVGFIISNEFCERFNYYGMRTILVLYLQSKLHYDGDTSTVLFHVFTMLVYLCPLAGAIIADSWLGKFKTIFYLSIIYAVGGVIVALGAVPPLYLPVKEATILGLVLIAVGTGGIKPCVSAFGGDQYSLPQQAKQLGQFFSLFYFAINAGSLISTSITPILREDVSCFGERDCYSLAFGVPAILMLMSVLIFVAGKRLYTIKPPAGNMIFCVTQCISEAFGRWKCERYVNPKKHWLDYAEPVCGRQMVNDTKILLKILLLYLPFPVFWALFDQQGSRWTFQATRMRGDFFGYYIKPDQMQVINPLLILFFIPLFDYVLYPVLAKVGIKRPLQKLTMGGLLAALAFLMSAALELRIQKTEPILPDANSGQLRIYNGLNCKYSLNVGTAINNFENQWLPPLGLFEIRNIRLREKKTVSFEAYSDDIGVGCPAIKKDITLYPNKAVGYFITDEGMQCFDDSPAKGELGQPLIRILLNVPAEEDNIFLVDSMGTETDLSKRSGTTSVLKVAKGPIMLCLNNTCFSEEDIQAGGVYAINVNGNCKDGFNHEKYVITEPNQIHMLWQLPQIIVITAAEIMFSVTGLEFSFTQAPQSMKSVLQACWLLTVAVGNMLVVVIAELKFFRTQAAEFTLFAALMIIDMLIFMGLASQYKYVEDEIQEKTEEDRQIGGEENKAYEP